MEKIYLPETLNQLLQDGAALVISISGGKDSQAMINRLVAEYRQQQWTGPIYAIHCDLGRAEWPQTLDQCRKMTAEAGIELVVIKRPRGDLVQEIEDRLDKLNGSGKPFWPSSSSRYCTSDQKRDQVDKDLRSPKPFWPSSSARYCTAHHKTNQADKQLRNFPVVISAEGIRADESINRAKKSPLSIRKHITSKSIRDLTIEQAINDRGQGQRLALSWYPIFDWSEDDVYLECGHSIEDRDHRRNLYQSGQTDAALDGWNMHPAYVFGNQRVSCALCILASKKDLIIGAKHNPWLLNHYIELEERGGATFKNGFSLKSLLPEVAQ